jgi:CrcB protein
MIGICGGYTTFSSFSLQTLNLANEGEWLRAGANILLSVVLCLAGVWLGWLLASNFNQMK